MSDEYHRNDFGNGSGVHADDFKDPKNNFLAGSGDTAGAGFFDSAFALKRAVNEGDSLSIGMASAGMAIEILGMVLDPIGSLLTAGIGWLIEHIVIFRWPLDFLLGDPKGIEAAKAAIYAEGQTVKQWSEDHAKATKNLMESWQGAAADQFRADMEGVAAQIDALSDYVNFAGKQMGIAGAMIGAVRGIVRDIIAMTLAGILKAAIVAVALAPVTFGGSIIAAITSIMTTVGVAIAKIAKQIADVAKRLAEMLKLLAKTRGKADEVVKLKLSGNIDKIKVPKPGSGGAKPPPSGGAGGHKPIEDVKKPDLSTEKPKKLSDIATWVVRDKLSKMPDATPEMMKKFDYWTSMPMPELTKRLGKSAEVLEKVVKILSDPTYGASGMAGKTVIEMMKSIPPAAKEPPPE
ncbi:WXG100 family type VII secretion target [Amycolatopsis orientalis]|uniref:WXG100 family type VII secretion target n=1 Tax=Amycolatopsis orientalis TaxID=31958 RepID=UPI0004041C43|nr:hypothetical protein [Amycolatopsis orientalis]